MSCENNPLEDTLVYDQQLPVRCAAFDLQANEQALAEYNRDNEILLHVLLGHEEASRESEEGRHENNLELQRLDAKINLLLNWVGQWMVGTQGIPAAQAVRLSERGIGLEVPGILNTGETLLLDVYLNPRYPQPLKLPCEVFSATHKADSTDLIACFVSLTTEIHDLIEKFIFRHHRRLVALHRQQETP